MSRPRFSETTILSVSKTTLANARSHTAALSEFGITKGLLDEFETDIQAAEALSSETHNRIILRGFTEDKDEALDNCYLWSRQLRLRLEMAFGENSPEAKSFPSRQFKNAVNSENGMMAVMKTLQALAGKHKETLAKFGQKAEYLAQGAQCLDDLRAKDSTQEVKKDEKKQKTQQRYKDFLKLYRTVKKINRVGRLVFANDRVNKGLFESKWPRAGSGVTVVDESEVVTEVEESEVEQVS